MEGKMGFGYIDDNDKSLQSKAGGKFGLNHGFVTVLEYNPNAGADGAAADAIDITVMVDQKEFRRRIYDITGPLYDKSNNQVEPDGEGYTELYNAELKQRMALVTHVVKALGVTDQQIQQALATPPANFAEWAKIMTALPGDDSKTKPVDVFLEWEWQIGEGNTQTFLQLPKNMKGGRFLCAKVEPQGGWKEVRDEKGLRYVDAASNEHPFARSTDYINGPKGNQQKEGEETSTEDSGLTANLDNGGGADAQPAKASW
jgi:hypothetical protein